MTSIKFQSLEDGELADIWYALGGSVARHPNHFQPLMDEVFAELESRRKSGNGRSPIGRHSPRRSNRVHHDATGSRLVVAPCRGRARGRVFHDRRRSALYGRPPGRAGPGRRLLSVRAFGPNGKPPKGYGGSACSQVAPNTLENGIPIGFESCWGFEPVLWPTMVLASRE